MLLNIFCVAQNETKQHFQNCKEMKQWTTHVQDMTFAAIWELKGNHREDAYLSRWELIFKFIF